MKRTSRIVVLCMGVMLLGAVAVGEPPPQARKQIDADVLSGLTADAEEQPQPQEVQEQQPVSDETAGNLLAYIVLLAGVLAASVILNVVLLVMRKG